MENLKFFLFIFLGILINLSICKAQSVPGVYEGDSVDGRSIYTCECLEGLGSRNKVFTNIASTELCNAACNVKCGGAEWVFACKLVSSAAGTGAGDANVTGNTGDAKITGTPKAPPPPAREDVTITDPFGIGGPGGIKGAQGQEVQYLIGRIISVMMGLVGSVALLMFVYGGFLWMTAAGNEDRVKKGKDVLLWAVAGLFIIFTSYILVYFVLGSLMGLG